MREFLSSLETLLTCIQVEMIAAFGGAKLHKVPRVADIEHEV